MISLLLAVLLAQEPEVLPVVDQPGAVCGQDEDCNCFQQMDTYTWMYRPCPEPAPAEPTVEPDRDSLKDPVVSVVGGANMSFGSEVPTSTTPFAAVTVDWVLWQCKDNPQNVSAFVEGTFMGLPDAEVKLESAADFDALEVALGASWRPLDGILASLYASGGFASRFSDGIQEPVTSAPMWSSFGLSFVDKGDTRARLRVGVGADERLGFGWTMALHVNASIRLPIRDKFGSTVMVRAILGLETPAGQTQRVNVITAGVGMSFDN